MPNSFAAPSIQDLALVGNSRLNRLINHRAYYQDPPDPASEEITYSASDYQALQAQVEALDQDKEKLTGVIENLRKSEKGYKTVKAILGDTNPEKLQEYVAAEEKARTMEERREQDILAARKEVKTEYQAQLDEANAKAEKAIAQAVSQKKEQQILRAYTQNGGINEDFVTFATLAEGNVEYNNKGTIEIRDDANVVLMFKPSDPKEDERPATLEDFMVMISDGQIDRYQFRHAKGLKRCTEAYNKASGANLPGSSSANGRENWRNLEGDALWAAAFKD